MKKWLRYIGTVAIAMCFLRIDAKAQSSAFTAQVMKTTQTESFQYWLYTPADPVEGMPLIVYLHGGSGKGSDLSLITNTDGFPAYLQSGQLGNLRAYVVMPQLSGNQKGWTDAGQSLLELIEHMAKTYGIDQNNVSLTGHSMGGTGTWGVALSYPATFARIAPLSGSVRDSQLNLNKLKNIPIRAFVGAADAVVDPETSKAMVVALQTVGADAQIIEFSAATHFDVPALTYLDPELGLMDWLIGAKFEAGAVRTASMTDALQYSTTLRMLEDATIQLQQTKNLYLDLNGCHLTGQIQDGGYWLYVKDSQTDDFTVEDAVGYGGVACTGGKLRPMNGYLQLQVEGVETFHRFWQEVTAVVLRPSAAGVDYQCQFFGDELVQKQVAAYGMAAGAGVMPNFRPCTYTSFTDTSTWNQPEKVQNGTLITGILNPEALNATNAEYAQVPIYGMPYVKLIDGTLLKGSCVKISLKEVMEGTETVAGVDELWQGLTQKQKEGILMFYQQYSGIFSQWKLPNIQKASGS